MVCISIVRESSYFTGQSLAFSSGYPEAVEELRIVNRGSLKYSIWVTGIHSILYVIPSLYLFLSSCSYAHSSPAVPYSLSLGSTTMRWELPEEVKNRKSWNVKNQKNHHQRLIRMRLNHSCRAIVAGSLSVFSVDACSGCHPVHPLHDTSA